MKLAARISGVDAPRRIIRLEDELAATLLDTASEALDREAEQGCSLEWFDHHLHAFERRFRAERPFR